MRALSPEALLACAPIAGLAVNVVVQIVVGRITRGERFARSVLAGVAAGAAAIAAVYVTVYRGSPAPTLAPGSTAVLLAGAHAGLCSCFFNFLNLNQTSLRVRMLKEIATAPGEVLAVATLLERYNADSVLDVRLERLLRGGHLVRERDRYLRGRRIEILALSRLLDLFKKLLIGAQSALPPPPP